MDKISAVTIYKRVKSETPKFWKKIRRLMVTCGVIGGGLMAIPTDQIKWLPVNISGILVTLGIVGTAFASMTVNDIKQAEKNESP